MTLELSASSSSTVTRPHLFVFDFDYTLTVCGSHCPLEELAPDKEKLDPDGMDDRYYKTHRCWNRRMTELCRSLAEQGISTEQMIESMRQLELSSGTGELFRQIRSHQHKIVVLSNAFDVAVEECLRAHHLLALVEKIESNPVRQVQPVLIIDEYESPHQTDCQLCDPNMCKGAVVERYRKTNLYDKVIFVGDGDNDACPALRLNADDYAFAKNDGQYPYQMYLLLTNEYSSQLKCQLFTWKTMDDVHRTLKEKNIL